MAKIIASDLPSMSSAAKNSLDTACVGIKNVINSVDGFINNSPSSLTGSVWDMIRSRLNTYYSILKNCETNCNDLASAISSANNEMAAYISPYDEIDTSKEAEISTELSRAKSTLSSYYNKSAKIDSSDNSDDSDTEYIDVNALNDLIADLEKKLEIIRGLSAKDSACFGIIESYANNNQNISSQIASI